MRRGDNEEDIHQCVSAEAWENLKNLKPMQRIFIRQCPFCDHTTMEIQNNQ